MKIVMVLLLVGVCSGFSLRRSKNNDRDARSDECSGNVFQIVACNNLKMQNLCSNQVIFDNCCETCSEGEDEDDGMVLKEKEDELVRLLMKALEEDRK